VQLDLAVPSRGWLSTLLVASWLIVAVVCSAFFNWEAGWGTDRVTNVVAILITTSAGAAAMLAQREFGGVAARLVSRLRALAVVQIALPALAAGFLAYGLPAGDEKISVKAALGFVSALAFLIVSLISVAWGHSWRVGRSNVRSPWDMTTDAPLERVPGGYWGALRHFGYDSAAVGIRSAEAWHERYDWSDEKQLSAVVGLMEGFTACRLESCHSHGATPR